MSRTQLSPGTVGVHEVLSSSLAIDDIVDHVLLGSIVLLKVYGSFPVDTGTKVSVKGSTVTITFLGPT